MVEPAGFDRLIAVLTRQAAAAEELIVLAKEEREIITAVESLPNCPHCGSLNPVIRNEGGVGKMSEFVLIATCQACNNVFLATAPRWVTFKDKGEYERRDENVS